MRKLSIALFLASVSPIFAGGYANAGDFGPIYRSTPAVAAPVPASREGYPHYYWDHAWFLEWFSAYGPFYDCAGSRCYIGPPTERDARGRRHYGQYFYGSGGGYNHGR
jgi:hypothetical protein